VQLIRFAQQARPAQRHALQALTVHQQRWRMELLQESQSRHLPVCSSMAVSTFPRVPAQVRRVMNDMADTRSHSRQAPAARSTHASYGSAVTTSRVISVLP
jgi:hypothetical protein